MMFSEKFALKLTVEGFVAKGRPASEPHNKVLYAPKDHWVEDVDLFRMELAPGVWADVPKYEIKKMELELE